MLLHPNYVQSMNVQCRISVKISARLVIVNMFRILPDLYIHITFGIGLSQLHVKIRNPLFATFKTAQDRATLTSGID